MLGRLGAFWGVAGVALLLADALVRLFVHARDAFESDLSPLQWAALAVWVALMTYVEGWRGFHLRFSPRVVARALTIASPAQGRGVRLVDVVLAPVFCMSLYGASRRGVRAAWILLAFIVAFILIVRTLPAPWRGIVDAGVVAGIGTGLCSLLYYATRAVLGRPPVIDPDCG